MKKLIFTLMLAIAGGVWTISSACGVLRTSANLPGNTVILYGDFLSVPSPCYDTVCTTCMTYAFYANGTLYYLSSADEQIRQQLDIEVILPSAHATMTGTTYKIENDDWLNVQSVAFGLKPKEVYHPMLAVGKQWSYLYTYGYIDLVWENGQSTMTMVEEGKTSYAETITDTVRINGKKYFVVKNLHTTAGVQPQVYMREDTIAQKVWVRPNEESEEQLLYSFDVAIGDTLRNITYYPAENKKYILSLAKYVVTNIYSTDGRKTIQLHAIVPYGPEFDPNVPPFEDDFTWIEGIGERRYGLSATWYDDDKVGGISSTSFLCVQQDGDLLYATAKGKEIGCEYSAPEPKIESLCDTWNVLAEPFTGGSDRYLRQYRLTTDTTVNAKRYIKLESEYYGFVQYEGALREGGNHDIYIVPRSSTHEYLLYAFNANIGDLFGNVWVGDDSYYAGGFTLGVTAIEEMNGHKAIKLDVAYQVPEMDYPSFLWIEGVGYTTVPNGMTCFPPCASDYGTYTLLCAYKDDRQVYVSEASKTFGCWYDSNEQAGDTVKLYRHVNDGPGSSTVDPVDPNQIVVILQQDLLIMREYMGDEIQYTLQKSLVSDAPAKANTPAMSKRVQANTFRGSASVRLTEKGTYRLDLTNPDWDYSIYGEFKYGTTDVEPVIHEAPATKVIRNGHLLIQKGDKLYTLTGEEMK